MFYRIVVAAAVAATASGCLGTDYSELCEKRVGEELGGKPFQVRDSSWRKLGSNVTVLLTFDTTNAKGQTMTFMADCSIEGDKIVRFTARMAES